MKAELTRFHIESTDEWLGHCTADTIWDELAELERLAEIGRATEKAFETTRDRQLTLYFEHEECIEIETIDELLDWAKED